MPANVSRSIAPAPPLEPALVQSLIDIVGAAHVLTDADERAPFETDWTGRFAGRTPAVVRPGTTAEVGAVVEACRVAAVAVVPQGGNTGLVGGGVPLAGEIVLSARRLDSIGPVDTTARQVTAGAGATLAAVQQAARAHGLRYAVDLAARDSATVGGSIATNAGGLHVLRYGGTREQVLGVDAVLGNGAHVQRLQGLVKDNTGYHLPSLLCGSEGTLGIVTAARLRLVAEHAHKVVAILAFERTTDAVRAVAALRSALDSLEAAELFLDPGLRLVCDAFDLRPPFERAWPVYVLVEVAAHEDPTDALAAAVAATSGVGDVAVADDATRRAALWRLREDHTLAINTLGPPHKFDVTLPLDALAPFLDDIPGRISAVAPTAQTWLFGHVGDGNVHVNVTGLDPHDERVADLVLGAVLELDGSISAEHGIGTAKLAWMAAGRRAGDLAAMRAIKEALDPDGICNPNVLLPPQ